MQAHQIRQELSDVRSFPARQDAHAARGISAGRALAFALVLALVLIAGAMIVRSLTLSQSGSTTISVTQQAPDAADRNAAEAAQAADVERWQGLAGGTVLREQPPDATDRDLQPTVGYGIFPTE